MKVAHVTSALGHEGAGLRTVVEELSAQQVLVGRGVHVFGLETPSWTAGARAEWAGAPASAFRFRGPSSFGYSPSLFRSLSTYKPDVVHLHGLWTFSSLAAFRVSYKLRAARVISPHGMLDNWALAQSSLKKRAALAIFERANLSGATIHALCQAEADAIRALGVESPIAVIPNGVAAPTAAMSGPELPLWHGVLPLGARVMLFLGRIHPKKGLADFIRAMAQLRFELEDRAWHLVVAGWDQDGHRGELEAVLRQNCLSERVHFVGPVFGEEKANTLSAAELFVLPSHSEGLPMAVLEAWRYKLPVLMTPQCNLPEGAAARAGWIAEPEPSALAAQLRLALAQPPEVLAAIGRNGAQLVANHFTWKVLEAQFSALYKWVSEGGERPAFVQ